MSQRLCLFVVLGLVLMAGVAPAAGAAGAWTVRTDIVPDGDGAVCVDFVDAQNGWIGLSGGGILRTTDGGVTWTSQTTGLTSPIYQIVMIDAQTGWARSAAATALRTTDGGQHWTAMKVFPGGDRTTDDLAAVSADAAWVLYDGRLCRTTDGGATWAQYSGFNASDNVWFTSAATGWVTDGGSILSTTDGGETWTATYIGDNFRDIEMFDAERGIATAANARYVTADGGSTWERQSMMTDAILSRWGDTQHGWVMRSYWDGSQEIQGTDDGGSTWFPQTAHDSSLRISEIDVLGESGWAAAGAKVLATQKNGLSDMRPPATSFVGERVANHELTVGLETTDNVSPPGAVVTFYRVDGAESDPWSLWNPALPLVFKVPADPRTEASHTVYVYSVDAYGNEEAWHGESFAVDTQQPLSKLTPKVKWEMDYWNNTASRVTVSAVDKGPSGVWKTEICRDKVTWIEVAQGHVIQTPAPADHSGDGVFPIWVRSTDYAGNVETVQKHAVCVDTRRPTAGAPASAAVRRGGTARLRFRINDKSPCYSRGRVAVVITNRAGTKRYKVITPQAWYTKNRTHTLSFRCSLAPGTYRFWVWAADGAGNDSARAARNTLIVR